MKIPALLTRAVFFLLACLVLLCVFSYVDYSLLRDSIYFADGPIGIAYYMPQYAISYGRLKANLFATQIFKELEQNSTPSGMVYAILALKKLDPDFYVELAVRYVDNSERVECISGCEGYTKKLSDMFK